MTIYATYFDSNFLIRGLACLESLAAHSTSPPRFLVLALDEACAEAIRVFWPQLGQQADIEVLPLDALERAHPVLANAKATRSTVEYYFTLSPFLCAEALARARPGEAAVYIDADLYFFSDPGLALAADDGANIGVVEHRYPPDKVHLADLYGRFNVGWISFRAAAETEACLARWRQDCLASCVDEPTDGRYGDQKYLDAWPSLVTGLKVIDHPGVNLAQWNYARHRLVRGDDGRVEVDGDPLVFYHFTQVRRRAASLYEVYFAEHGPFSRLMCADIYEPYLRTLDRIDTLVSANGEWRAPSILLRKPLYKKDRWLIFWPWRAVRLFFRRRTIFRGGRLLSAWRSLPYA